MPPPPPPTKRIYSVTDAEPALFVLQGGAGATAYSLNISCEVVADPPFNDDERKTAQKFFSDFLDAAVGGKGPFKFLLVSTTADPTKPPNPSWTQTTLAADQILSAPPFEAAERLVLWLNDGETFRAKKARAGRADPAEADKAAVEAAKAYWFVRYEIADTAGIGAGVGEDDIGAAHELRSAHAWNAPVGHRFGLTHVVRLPASSAFLYILPYLGDTPPAALSSKAVPPPANSSPTQDADVVEFIYNCGGDLGDVTCRATRLLLLPPDQDGLPLVTPEGFLRIDVGPDGKVSDRYRRLLNSFEEQAATLVSPAIALTRISAAAAGIDDEDKRKEKDAEKEWDVEAVWKLFAPTWKNQDPKNGANAQNASWLAVAALCVALDPIVVALVRPATAALSAHHRPEGQLLSVLVSALLNQLTELSEDPAVATKIGAVRSYEITEGVRRFLANSALCMREPDRKVLVKALRHVHDLPSTDDASPSPDTLVEVLLKLFVGDQLDQPKSEQFVAVHAGNPPTGFGFDVMAAESTSGRRLQNEASFEGAVIRFFETATIAYDENHQPGTQDHPINKDAVAGCIAVEVIKAAKIPPEERDLVYKATDQAWRDFAAALRNSFNGTEAARRSASADFVSSLLEQAPAAGDDDAKTAALHDLIVGGSAYAASLFKVAPTGCFDSVFAALPRPQPPPHIKDSVDLKQLLDATHKDALAALDDFVAPTPRFIPDAVPHPLSVQIAEDMSPEKAEAFAHRFNGVGVALRRLDKPDPAGAEGGAAQQTPIAHLNLAELRWGDGAVDLSKPANVAAALHPILPSVTDGRSPLFVNYEGFPFASTAFHDTIPFADQPEDPRDPFYEYDLADYSGPAQDYAPAPQLAYGRTFEYIAFIVSNSGSMPQQVRKSDAEPWLPKAKIDPSDVTRWTARVDCQRRTAIGRVAVRDASDRVFFEIPPTKEDGPVSAAKIGAPIAGVYPLANDYPRLALFANGRASPGAVDLMRLLDGSGALELAAFEEGQKAEATVELADPNCVGGSGRLQALLFGPSADLSDGTAATVSVDMPISEPGPRELTVVVTAETGSDRPTTLSVSLIADGHAVAQQFASPPPPPGSGPRNRFWWLRLVLSADGDRPVALSFAEPEPVPGASHGLRDAPLLLLSLETSDRPIKPNGQKNPWVRRFVKARAAVSAPRTGFLDFERWFANPDRTQELRSAGVADATVRNFFRALLSAYVVRHADKGLADGLANLPDPSVARLRFRLVPADRLGQLSLPPKLQRIVHLTRILPAILGEAALSQPPRPEWIGDLTSLFGLCDDAGRAPKGIFSQWNLDARFTFRLDIQAGPALKIDPVDDTAPSTVPTVVTVPPGVVAYLEIAPLVDSKHFKPSEDKLFPAVFDNGMLQYAVGSDGDFVVFPATTIRIETMTDRIATDYLNDAGGNLRTFITKMTAAAPSGAARRYDVVTAKAVEATDEQHQIALRSAWRINGEIDTTTERWRPMGRPIHFFPDPRSMRDRSDRSRFSIDDKVQADPSTCSLQIPSDPNDDPPDLVSFEREIYFDRPDIDSQTVTQKLAPLPAPTVLHTVVWDAPSATYLRHRFTLRTRYDGALGGRTDTPTWTKTGRTATTLSNGEQERDRAKYEEWTLRVAMLADMSRLTITRPQVRGLLPLTAAPATQDCATSPPPILAILQEPPLGRGGLAERIGAELGLGFGYKFDTSDPKAPIHIFDSRKEIGRDARLTYRPFDSAKALGMALRVEGPLGLTFDDLNAPSPAFPNSLAILSPDSVTADAPPNLEEHFLGVSLRRWLDPSWTVRSAAAVDKLPATNAQSKNAGASAAQSQTRQPDAVLASGPQAGQPEQPTADGQPLDSALDPDLCWWVELPGTAVNGQLGDYDQNGKYKVTGDYSIGLVAASDLGELHSAPNDRTVADALVVPWLTIGDEVQTTSPTSGTGIREISIASIVIDPVPISGQVVVGRFAKNCVDKLHLLHQPVAAGRYSTSILATTKPTTTSTTNFPRPALPVLLATFEWSPRRFVSTDQPPAPILSSRLVSLAIPPPHGSVAWSPIRAIASVPTSLVWTRTGRDHDRWLLYHPESGAPGDPISASALKPILAQSGETWILNFGEDYWLCSSTFAEPRTPVHVHRRVAVIATRYAGGGGRPVELYSAAALLDGREAALPLRTNEPAPQLCRLVEFETPAMVLTNKDAAVPETYRSAYFDLKSILGKGDDPSSRTIDFYFRFVGRRKHLKQLTRLTIILTALGTSASAPSAPTFDAPRGNAAPLAFRLRIFAGEYRADFLMSDGNLVEVKPSEPTLPPIVTDDVFGLIMKVDVQTSQLATEFWTDVSMLHSANGSTDTFDFNWNWLFSAAVEGVQEPAEAVRPTALAEMAEAQARIIAISPAIPIQRQNI